MNQAQGYVKLVKDTDMSEEDFRRIFHDYNIISLKVEFVSPKGELHTLDLGDFMNLEWNDFQNNDEEKEKPLSNELSDQIAI
ncbi:hypothetical protein [Bacillus xiapuensis]|uniref:Uncharacterized protein n=1 Tax=Bacillus xiapuensis TaxID=2014075 RepID=A0ABU6NAP6_9BACI|nr:hypothetical protein [Bacillus xiapuensis]